MLCKHNNLNPEETIDYYLKSAWQNIVNNYNQIAAPYGITQAMGYILISIDDEKGITVSGAAQLLGVKTTSLSRMLNKLEELGLIRRKTDSHDKRQVFIFLTAKGLQKKKLAKKVVREFNEYLDRQLSNSEKKNLIRIIQKINIATLDYQQKLI